MNRRQTKQTKPKKAVNTVARRKPQNKRSNYANYLRSGGSLAGGALASMMGVPPSIGSTLGGLAGSLISNISGQGAYKIDVKPEIMNRINHNTVIKPHLGDQIPAFGHLGDGTRIQHREYIGDIYSSINFKNNVYPVQLGSQKTFPWASQLAPLYSQYKIMGLVFEFRSMYSDSVVSTSANASLGSLIGCCEYNANALPFNSPVQMQNALFAESVKPSDSCIFAIECDPYQTPSLPLYTSLTSGYANPALANDQRLNSLGNFQIATVGNQSDNQNLGQIWVSYDIMLYKQQLDVNEYTESAKYKLLGGNGSTFNPLGEQRIQVYDNIGLTISNLTGDKSLLEFELGSKGEYLLYFNHNGEYSFNGVNNITYTLTPINCNITTQFASTAGADTATSNTGLQLYSGNSNVANNFVTIINIPDDTVLASVQFICDFNSSYVNRNPNYGDLICCKLKY